MHNAKAIVMDNGDRAVTKAMVMDNSDGTMTKATVMDNGDRTMTKAMVVDGQRQHDYIKKEKTWTNTMNHSWLYDTLN